MKPQTNRCPFCKADLSYFNMKEQFQEIWHCATCLSDTSDDISRYVVICFDRKDTCAYQQQFTVKDYFVYNTYSLQETKVCKLISAIIIDQFYAPFQEYDLENLSEDELYDKLKLYATFA